MDCGEVRENGAKYPNQRVVNIKFNAGIKPGERSRFCPVQLNLYWAAYQDLANYPKAFAYSFNTRRCKVESFFDSYLFYYRNE